MSCKHATVLNSLLGPHVAYDTYCSVVPVPRRYLLLSCTGSTALHTSSPGIEPAEGGGTCRAREGGGWWPGGSGLRSWWCGRSGRSRRCWWRRGSRWCQHKWCLRWGSSLRALWEDLCRLFRRRLFGLGLLSWYLLGIVVVVLVIDVVEGRRRWGSVRSRCGCGPCSTTASG